MKYLFSILFGLAALTGYAQTDPNMTGTDILGTGVPAGNPVSTPYAPNEPVSFTINAGNAGTSTMRYPPPGKFEININITNMGTPVIILESGTNYFDPPIITDLGGGVWTIKMVQNAAIPPGGNGTFRISGVASRDLLSGDGKYYVSYQANGKPGSYANAGSDSKSFVGVIDEALPVILTSFEVNKEGRNAVLSWATTEESNSDRFDIQRSQNGKSWARLGSVTSGGESKTLRNYSFTDSAPQNGENLYRLKMIDKDATFAYSRIRSVRFEGAGDSGIITYVYPNPSSDRIFLSATELAVANKAVIMDMNGHAVLNTTATADGVDVRKLAAGTYVLKVSGTDGSSSVHKFVIAR